MMAQEAAVSTTQRAAVAEEQFTVEVRGNFHVMVILVVHRHHLTKSGIDIDAILLRLRPMMICTADFYYAEADRRGGSIPVPQRKPLLPPRLR